MIQLQIVDMPMCLISFIALKVSVILKHNIYRGPSVTASGV